METVTKPEYGDVLWGNDTDTLVERLERLELPGDVKKQVRDFYENGFVRLEGVFSNEMCDQAVRQFDEWVDGNRDRIPEGVKRNIDIPRVVNLHAELTEFKDLISMSDRLKEFVKILFGFPMSVYTSLAFKYGTEQPFHIDTPVFRTAPEDFYFGVWVALEDAGYENGCLQVLKKGHRVPRVEPYSFLEEQGVSIDEVKPGAQGLWSPYQNQTVKKCRDAGCEEMLVPAKKGDVVIWHPQLPHSGSKINTPSLTRYSAVFHVVPEGTPVYQADVFFNEERKYETTTSSRRYEHYNDVEFMATQTKIGVN